MLTDAARERTRRFPPRYGGRVGIRVVGASARRPTRNGLLEPNGRRAARLVTDLVHAKRAMNASGWLEAVPHPPRAAVRPRGAARLAIRASITIVAWRARSCSQATRRRPKPSRRRPASDAPAWAPRPHPRCKTGRGCDTGPQRRKDDNPTAGHEQLCGACGLSRRAPDARSQRRRPSSPTISNRGGGKAADEAAAAGNAPAATQLRAGSAVAAASISSTTEHPPTYTGPGGYLKDEPHAFESLKVTVPRP